MGLQQVLETEQDQERNLREYRLQAEKIIYEDYGDNSRRIHWISRQTLNEWQKKLEISLEKAATIEAEILNNCLNYEEKIQEYKQVLEDTMQTENGLDEKTINRLKNYQNALGLDDETIALAYTSLGNQLHKQGELQKAIFLFNEAINFNSYLAAAYVSLGVIFYKQGKQKESRKILLIAESLFKKQGLLKEAEHIKQFYQQK